MLSEAITYQVKEISKVYAQAEWAEQYADLTKKSGSDIFIVNKEEMGRISALSSPGLVMAIMDLPSKLPVESFPGITLLLDSIQDPGNLGTIIRTADWFGIRNIICGEGCADCYNPKVIQSTMGSIFRVNLMYQDLSAFHILHPDIPVLVSSLEGRLLDESVKSKQAFLVIGNESRGVSENIMKYATQKIRIPGSGTTESLNAAVATGILLYWLTLN